MRRTMLIVVVLTLGLLGGCQGITMDEAENQFCDDLSAFTTALNVHRSLDENSTLEEVTQARMLVAEEYDDLARSASTLRSVQFDTLDEAYNALLLSTVDNLEGETTVGEANAEIQAAVDAVDAAAVAIFDTNCR